MFQWQTDGSLNNVLRLFKHRAGKIAFKTHRLHPAKCQKVSTFGFDFVGRERHSLWLKVHIAVVRQYKKFRKIN